MTSSGRSSCDKEPRSTQKMEHKPLEFLYEQFTDYIEDRRRAPRDDVMTGLATATFPDGTLPPVNDVMRIAANLFSAGGETTARLMSTSFRILGDRPDLQQALRDESRQDPRLHGGGAAARAARSRASSACRRCR